ncbi:MAG: hypothetical protein P4L50_29645 [Anaerolineaceae bacterium]|nr:hypothetical protein [Anaerolineaceae bacterium]
MNRFFLNKKHISIVRASIVLMLLAVLLFGAVLSIQITTGTAQAGAVAGQVAYQAGAVTTNGYIILPKPTPVLIQPDYAWGGG